MKKRKELDAKIARHEQAARNLLADWAKARAEGDHVTEHVLEESVRSTNWDLVRLRAERALLD